MRMASKVPVRRYTESTHAHMASATASAGTAGPKRSTKPAAMACRAPAADTSDTLCQSHRTTAKTAAATAAMMFGPPNGNGVLANQICPKTANTSNANTTPASASCRFLITRRASSGRPLRLGVAVARCA